MTEKKANQPVMLVAGASGIVGRAAVEYFSEKLNWRVIGLSRRAPDLDFKAVEHLQLDLQDQTACEKAAAGLADVTHVIYAALFEKPGLVTGWVESDQMQTNLQMLQNLMVPLQHHAKLLEHVSLLQGTKAYGAHVGRMSVPGKERAPRVEHPNFYWLQEDWLSQQRANARWALTIWRPPLIIGHALGAPMNLLSVIGVFGSLAAAKSGVDRSFGWPGGVCGPTDAVDARLLAQAFAWAVTDGEAAAADQTFNITNGDVFVPSEIWPRLATCFGLPAGPDKPQRLRESLPLQAEHWQALVTRHQLLAPPLEDFVGDSLIYADLYFNAGSDTPAPSPLLSTIKLRQAGFAECMDSEDMFVDWLARLQQRRILPECTPDAETG